MTVGGRSHVEALRQAHAAAAYNEWLAAEIQEAIDDPRLSIPHDEVMAKMDADIAALKAKHGEPERSVHE